MKLISKIENIVSIFYRRKRSEIKTTSELDKKIINDALPVYEQSLKKESATIQPNIWGIIMRSKLVKLSAVAVILLAIILGINFLGAPINRANTVFAAAMDSIKKARTFSCIVINEVDYKDNQTQGRYLSKEKIMFKEPDLERHEVLTSHLEENKGEITIWDYSKRQMLDLKPYEKKANLKDLSFSYEINDKTGEIELTKLDTSLRDQLLELSMGTFNDQGNVELDGKSVLMLESEKKGRVTTVWIDPKTNYPVQIEQKWPNQERSPVVLYTSIQIDTELDDELFSLEPPEGYEISVFTGAWPKDKSKLGAKIKHLGMLCFFYASKNNDEFPDKFEDLVTSGVTNEYALGNVLAAPDDPDKIPIFRYRKPNIKTLETDNMSIEVMIYEDYEGRSADEQVVVTMLDSGSALIPVQTLKELLKPWPAYQKNLVNKMTLLHSGCIKYAKEHEGRLPNELSELADGIFLERVIKLLLSAPGQPEGPDVIKYRIIPEYAEQSTEVMFYEIYEMWPEDGAMVCYGNGDCEIITDQNKFEELIK